MCYYKILYKKYNNIVIHKINIDFLLYVYLDKHRIIQFCSFKSLVWERFLFFYNARYN